MEERMTRASNKTNSNQVEAPQGRRRRRLFVGLGITAAVPVCMWGALHAFPGFGPAMADGARSVLGPGAVAWAEDTVYGIEDRIKRVVYRNAPPKTYWEEPAATAPSPALAKAEGAPGQPGEEGAKGEAKPAEFAPANYEAPFPKVASPSDGRWIPIVDPADPAGAPAMFKSLVHPDPRRSFAAVAVVAIDLSRVDLTMVLGTVEPRSQAVSREQRPGVIPRERFDTLLAAFNGGFKAEHGHYGAMLDGQTLIAPRDTSCTVALYKDSSIEIRTWPVVRDRAGDMTGYRQTPPCLVEQGQIHERLLQAEESKGWGAAVGGETVIRRSSIGLSSDHKTLFYGFGDSVSAGSLARAMKAAGSEDAAQLDVNGMYPRFLFYGRTPPGGTPQVSSALVPDVPFVRSEYVGRPEGRDFFYLTRKPRRS